MGVVVVLADVDRHLVLEIRVVRRNRERRGPAAVRIPSGEADLEIAAVGGDIDGPGLTVAAESADAAAFIQAAGAGSSRSRNGERADDRRARAGIGDLIDDGGLLAAAGGNDGAQDQQQRITEVFHVWSPRGASVSEAVGEQFKIRRA